MNRLNVKPRVLVDMAESVRKRSDVRRSTRQTVREFLKRYADNEGEARELYIMWEQKYDLTLFVGLEGLN